LFRNIDSGSKSGSDLISEEKNEEEESVTEDIVINVPVRELSVLINQQLGRHFYDFVNIYRIETAMQNLKDPSKQRVTVPEILYKVGFNS
jgi:YesN/AraC family two-component response regulator